MATPLNTDLPVITVTGNAPNANLRLASNGTWTGTATINYTYQWQNGTNLSSLSNISGATANTFQTNASYPGNVFICVVYGTNAEGTNIANTLAFVNSNQLANVDTYKQRIVPQGNLFLSIVEDSANVIILESNSVSILPDLTSYYVNYSSQSGYGLNVNPNIIISIIDSVGANTTLAEANSVSIIPDLTLVPFAGNNAGILGLGIEVSTVYAATDSQPIKVVGSGTYWTTG